MALVALSHGLLTRKQANKRKWDKEIVAVFSENWGMYGDIVIVTSIVSWAVDHFILYWSKSHTEIALGLSLPVCTVLIYLWSKESLVMREPFGKDGKINGASLLHFIYMIPVIGVLILFYFWTPKSVISHKEAIIVTLLLMIHLFFGILQPPYALYKRYGKEIGKVPFIIVGVLYVLLIAGCLRLIL